MPNDNPMFMPSGRGRVPHGVRILIVDDDSTYCSMLTEQLKKEWECESICCKNGREALHILRAGDIDLCFLDLSLPGMDGVETYLHAKAESIDVPTVFVSGCGDSDLVGRALSETPAIFMVKDNLDLDIVSELLHFPATGSIQERNERDLRKKTGHLPSEFADSPAYARKIGEILVKHGVMLENQNIELDKQSLEQEKQGDALDDIKSRLDSRISSLETSRTQIHYSVLTFIVMMSFFCSVAWAVTGKQVMWLLELDERAVREVVRDEMLNKHP